MNGTLFDAIQQLPYLRQVWFTSHRKGRALKGLLLTFVEGVQRMSLPYLHAFFLWTPNNDPWSYAFRKEGVRSVNDGCWVCETNVNVRPSVD
jgi:hypothetical protein